MNVDDINSAAANFFITNIPSRSPDQLQYSTHEDSMDTQGVRASPRFTLQALSSIGDSKSLLSKKKQGGAFQVSHRSFLPAFDAKPRVPERFNELSIKHQERLMTLVDANIARNNPEVNTQAARDDRAASLMAIKSFQEGEKPMIMSMLTMKPLKPSINLVGLKEFAREVIRGEGEDGHSTS